VRRSRRTVGVARQEEVVTSRVLVAKAVVELVVGEYLWVIEETKVLEDVLEFVVQIAWMSVLRLE
jgi:hypothetical protein